MSLDPSSLRVFPASLRVSTAGLRPESHNRLYPGPRPLADLDDFRYLVNPDACGSDAVNLLILVTSHPRDTALRGVWRRHLTQSHLAELGAKRVFMLGIPSDGDDPSGDPSIEEEHSEHGDVLQGNFLEAYRNLTYKHLMGLDWAARFCPQAKFVLKMDDDIAIDIYQMDEMLAGRSSEEESLLGFVQAGLRPIRETGSKWFVEEREFSGEEYPTFLSGWAYLATTWAAARLVEEAEGMPCFWIDDVYVTGILAERAGLPRRSLTSQYTPFAAHAECCARASDSLCDHVAAPTTGDADLLRRFLVHARACRERGCTRPPPSLGPRCIGVGRHLPETKGAGQVFVVRL